MQTMRLGRTGLIIGRTGFGALPMQRVSFDEAKLLLVKAYGAGVTFFDTARGYSDSEEKIGYALSGVRSRIVIATKTFATDRKGLLDHLAVSLKNMKTDYVDILQLHNPKDLPDVNDPESSWAGLMEAKKKGMIRFAGISSHIAVTATKAVQSGLFDTLQYPLSSISADADLAIIGLCRQHDVGLIAMKGMVGGLLTDARSAFAFLRQFDNVVPIWGVQRERELDEFLALDANPPKLDAEILARIEKDRRELAGDFCRACGYCLPCPAGIPIPFAARMGLLLRRMPWQQFMSDEWNEKMHRIEKCTDCGRCRRHCPYGLDTPALLTKMLANYDAFVAEKRSER